MPAPLPPYKLAVCTMFYNEGRYLLEWVLYHYLIGFQHFYLYDNDSTDGSTSVLQPLVARGLVTLIPWPGQAPQGRQIDHCFNTSAPRQTSWLASFDVDEFVVVLTQKVSHLPFLQHQRPFMLHAFLDRFKNWRKGAVIIDRMNFGCSGHRAPPAGLTMQAYTERDVPLLPAPVVGKVVVLFEALRHMRSAHDASLLPDWDKVTVDLDVYNEATTRGNRFEPVRINHYLSRSYDECVAKLTLNKWPDAMDWRKKNGQRLCDRRMEGTAEVWIRKRSASFAC